MGRLRTWWVRACTYRVRLDEEAFRLNTVSPPPPREVMVDTLRIHSLLGPLGSLVAIAIPIGIARRHSTGRTPPP